MSETANEPTPAGRRLGLQVAACGAGSLALFLLAARTPMEGFRKYSLAAEHLLNGQLAAERLIDFSPFYLWLNVAWLRLGFDPARLEAVHIVLAAISVALLFALIAARLGPRWAWAGALIFAFDRHVLTYHRVLEPEMILLASLLGSLFLLERPGFRAAFGAGLLATVAVLTRPTFLPIFAAVPLYYRWRRGHFEWKKESLVFLAPLLVGGLLLSFHAGSPLAPVMNPGTVFFEGNQPLSQGTSAIYPPLVLSLTRSDLDVADSAHEHYRSVARAAAAASADAPPTVVNGLWAARARSFLGDHPAAAFERLRTKLLYAFHAFRWHDVPSAARYERRLGWPSLPFSALASLALLGLVAAARNWRAALPFYLLFAVQLAVMLTFYVSARQRLVLLPAIIFFALVALRAGFEKSVPRRQTAAAATLCLLMAAVLTLPDDAMRDEAYQQRGFVEAGPRMAALQSGGPLATRRADIVAAMAAMPWWVDWMRPAFIPQEDHTLDELLADELLRVRDHQPFFSVPSAEIDLAAALVRAGRDESARPILQGLIEQGFRAYRGGRAPSDPRLLLAELEMRQGRKAAALELAEAALSERPGDFFALAALAALDPAQESDRVAELDRFVGEPDRRWIFGRMLRRFGQPSKAAAQFAPLVARLPDLRELRVELALALGAAGDLEPAVAELLAANQLHVEPVIEVEATAEIVRRWAGPSAQATTPEEAETQILAARLLHQHGFPSEALERLSDVAALGELPAELAARVEAARSELRARQGHAIR